MLVLFLVFLTAFSYCFVTVQQSQLLFQSQPQKPRAYHISSLIALIGQAYLLYLFIDTDHGQNLHSLNLFCLTTWLIACFVYGSSLFTPFKGLAVLTYPVAALSLILAWSWPGHALIATGDNLPLLIHILLSLMAMSLVGYAAIQATFTWFIHYLLHAKKNPHALLKLPPLETMEGMLIQILIISFIVMSLTVCSGIFFLPSEMQLTAPSKMLFSVFSWALIGILLLGHYLLGWRGLMATKITFLITLLLIIGYYISHLLTSMG